MCPKYTYLEVHFIMRLKDEIVRNEEYFVQILNYLNPQGGYTTSKRSTLPCPCHTASTKGSNCFSWKDDNGTIKGKCNNPACSLNEYGNIIDVYMKANGIDDFKTALKEVADILGINGGMVTPVTPITPTLPFKNKKSVEPKEEPQDRLKYIEQAHSNVGKTDYYYKRGLTKETIEKYKLGYMEHCKVGNFDNGDGAIVPYPNEPYYFTRIIHKKGDYEKLKLPGQVPLFNGHCILDRDIIWVTEGQFDCLSLLQCGVASISTDSANNYNSLIKYIEDNNVTDKVFVVAYDNDEAGLIGAEKLISLLKEKGMRTTKYVPTGGKDINEMLVNCKEQLENDIQEVEQKALDLLDTPVKDYITDKGLDIGALVLYVKDNNYLYRKGNLVYKYNSSTGVYDVLEEEEVQEYYYKVAREDGTTKDINYKKCDNFSKTLFQIVQYHTETMDEMRYIACNNGIVDITTNELLPFDPKYKLDCKFNGNFNADYESWLEKFNNSKFYSFLKDILVGDDVITTLQEMWGNMLCPNSTKIQQIFIYLGDGSNGKSSLFDIQESLLASKNKVCGISLGDFGERFALSMAQGKRINIVRDDRLVNDVGGKFKSAITGEPVTTEQKNKDHKRQSFNMAWFYGVNKLPNTTDKTHGYYRRNCIIPFNVTFGTKEEVAQGKYDKVKIPGLVNSIKEEEQDIIFMWAYWGLQRLIKNNYVLTPNEASTQAMEEYREDTDTVYTFYKYCIVSSTGNDILGNELHSLYCDWCENNHYTPMNIQNFGKQIKSFGVKYKRTNKGITYLNIDVSDDVKFTSVKGVIPFKKKNDKTKEDWRKLSPQERNRRSKDGSVTDPF